MFCPKIHLEIWFAHKISGNSYRNLILARELYFITQSHFTKFELKATCKSKIIYCKLFCQFMAIQVFLSMPQKAQEMRPEI